MFDLLVVETPRSRLSYRAIIVDEENCEDVLVWLHRKGKRLPLSRVYPGVCFVFRERQVIPMRMGIAEFHRRYRIIQRVRTYL